MTKINPSQQRYSYNSKFVRFIHVIIITINLYTILVFLTEADNVLKVPSFFPYMLMVCIRKFWKEDKHLEYFQSSDENRRHDESICFYLNESKCWSLHIWVVNGDGYFEITKTTISGLLIFFFLFSFCRLYMYICTTMNELINVVIQ